MEILASIVRLAVLFVATTHVTALQTVSVQQDDENFAETWNSRAQSRISSCMGTSWGGSSAPPMSGTSGVLFVGGGMSLHTLKATRHVLGQARRQETPLYFEGFPVTGMIKTYCVDSQIPDAACTATALLRGVKGRTGAVGVPPTGAGSRCGLPDDAESERLGTIVEWALDAGKSVGIVTTSSLTQASVASTYTHSCLTSWESDADMDDAELDPTDCSDIAYQLVHRQPGNKFKVILGGGLSNFVPNDTESQGRRNDKKNLLSDWTNDKANKMIKSQFVSNRDELMNVNNDTEYLLGVFNQGPLEYHMLANASQPTLEEMTEAAIKMLSKNNKGFFLFVFGGRINDAHDQNKARLAVDETIELNKAVKTASELTNPSETLVVVTADHAHTMTISGYSSRWLDIFGEAEANPKDRLDHLPYLTITYANGPGFRSRNADGLRVLVNKEEKFLKHDPNFQFPAVFPLASGTTGGEDVVVFAKGPSQNLFNGVLEQHLIPHIMAYSMCIGPGLTSCENMSSLIISPPPPSNSTHKTSIPVSSDVSPLKLSQVVVVLIVVLNYLI